VGEIRHFGWQSRTNSPLVLMGLIPGNRFGDLHSSQKGEFKALRESFTAAKVSQ
jgi:hypothetical protein